MIINKSKLKQNNSGNDYETGYRIVYFYDDKYKISEYCKTIEGFMIGFSEFDPIIDEDDIPLFISTNDLLNRYLNDVPDATDVAIYDVNGECIDILSRENIININNKKV